MTQDEIMKMAREAGLHIATDVNWMPIIGLEYAEKFAALVIANHPPQSFMSWQEGYEAGKQTEREACAKVCESYTDKSDSDHETHGYTCAIAIRARGQA
jgi:hypothetical protein